MIKKMIVLIQLAVIATLGALIIGQIGISPERAKRINKQAPLWFMNPWRVGDTGNAGDAAGATPQEAGKDKPALASSIRRAVLAPSPALDAMITELESKGLETSGPVLIPAKDAKPAPEAPKKPRPAAAPRKKPAAPAAGGPLRVTGLQIVPAANGVIIQGSTSAPVERMDLYTYASPPRMILELYGSFAPYDGTIAVPPNGIVQSVTTEVTPNKLRLVGTLRTDKATVAPVSRTSGRDGFAVELTTTASDGQVPAPGGQAPVPGDQTPAQAPH